MTDETFDLKSYLNLYIHFDITVQNFIDRVKQDPFKIIDYDIRYAIEVLQEKSIKGTQIQSKVAREILKEVGLKAFITEESSKRKTSDPNWANWQNNPRYLIDLILNIESKIRPIWVNHETDNLKGKRKAVCEMIETLFDTKPEDILINKIARADRCNHLSNVALSIFAEFEGLSYSVVYKFYFNTHKDLRKSMEKEKQRETVKAKKSDFRKLMRKLEIKDKKFVFDIRDFWKAPDQGIYLYLEAYQNYKNSIKNLIPFLGPESVKGKIVK